jgi:hypothetical protein
MEQNLSMDKPATYYRVKVQGRLTENWSDWFSGMTVTFEGGSAPITTLTGAVADQAALRGMLCKLWDLNLTLISVRRIEADSKKEEDND